LETLDLERIRNGFPGITPRVGEYQLESCVICLERQNHHSGTQLKLSGDIEMELVLLWTLAVTKQMERTWSNQKEATESGAICIAALLIEKFTEYTILEKAREGTGIDYWLGHKNRIVTDYDLFHRDARLEISGIFDGNSTEIAARFKMKLLQTDRSDHSERPVFVCVVEFGHPQVRLGLKNDRA
jgi:hypothetical protein